MDLRGLARAAVLLVIVLLGAACAPPGPVPIPTFPPDPPSSVAATSRADRPLADCTDVLPPDQLPGLLALPVDSVRVRTVLDRAAPAVGRLGRMRCTYSAADPVLSVDVGTFTDAAAARDQYERNVADLSAGARSRVQPELGAAAATAVVQQQGGTTLLTVLGPVTVDLRLGSRPTPLAPTDLLVDLARRVWARVDSADTGAVAPAP